MDQNNAIKVLLLLIGVLVIALVLRMTVFKDVSVEKTIDLNSEAVVNSVANKTSAYVNSTQVEKNRYNELTQSMDSFSK